MKMAEIPQNRIVTCRGCVTKNRVYIQNESGLNRCANCKNPLRNPFLIHQWYARLKNIPKAKVLGLVSLSAIVAYAIYLQVKVNEIIQERDAAVKLASDRDIALTRAEQSSINQMQQQENDFDARRTSIREELIRMGIPASQADAITNSAVSNQTSDEQVDDALLRHLSTDNRLATGSILVDQLSQFSGQGKLTLENGLVKDAYVKLVRNGQLVAAFYVRGNENFSYSTIPDGTYGVLYCTGYGWDADRRDFNRGREAQRYDDPLTYITRQQADATGVTYYYNDISLTLNPVPDGNVRTSEISLAEFDKY